ncbi:MAG: guanylate kinase [Oscillospiraceae bacterium]|nr:guanylate kinase [Oscillospiraceae bacterium]
MMDDIQKPGKLIVISGPSGSGKSAVLQEVRKLAKYKFSVSYAARAPREGERDGIDYHFISKEDFLEKVSNGEMLEYVNYSDNYYGTPKLPLERLLNENHDVILEIEVNGAMNIKEKFPDAVMIFLICPTRAELEKRLRERGTENEKSIQKRLETAEKEVASMRNYDYLVKNESGMQKRAAFEIECIIEAEKDKITGESAERFLKNYFA